MVLVEHQNIHAGLCMMVRVDERRRRRQPDQMSSLYCALILFNSCSAAPLHDNDITFGQTFWKPRSQLHCAARQCDNHTQQRYVRESLIAVSPVQPGQKPPRRHPHHLRSPGMLISAVGRIDIYPGFPPTPCVSFIFGVITAAQLVIDLNRRCQPAAMASTTERLPMSLSRQRQCAHPWATSYPRHCQSR
jgi:hypothetical protein